MSGDTQWRWADPSGQQRRVQTDELRAALASGAIAPNTPVWRDGWTEWRPATDVPELTTSALSAQNGVVPNIPPPPMVVVAAQHAFEGDEPERASNEPPPPPRYVPAPRAVAAPASGSGPTPPPRPSAFPVNKQAPHYSTNANTAVNIRALHEGDAHAIVSSPSPPAVVQSLAKARESQPPDQRETVPHPPSGGARPSVPSRPSAPGMKSAPPPPPSRNPPPPVGIPTLIRGSTPPPPAVRTMSSKPPPPPVRGSKPPPKKQAPKGPSKVEDAGKEVIEELSGSILLADASGAQPEQAEIEELSGSILLADQSGPIQTGPVRDKSGELLLPDLSGPSPAVPPRANEELSGNFLLDAGSTGALPSVESTGKILAAKAASRAPFAPPAAEGPRLTPAPIIPIALPLGSVPPPPPANVAAGPGPSVGAPAADIAPQADAPPAPSAPPLEPAPPATVASPAQETLVGVPPPPPALLDEGPAAPLPEGIVPAPAAADAGEPPRNIPAPESSSARVHDFRAIRRDPRFPYQVAGFGAIGLLVLLGTIGLIVGVASGKKESDETEPAASASASASPSKPQAAAIPAAAPAGEPGAACTLAGAAHVIAPRAVVQSGVETSIVDSRLALGFASREHEGYAVTIDPSSAVAEKTVRTHTADPIRRLVPIQGAKGLEGSADVERESDFLAGRRTIPAQHPFDLGFGGGGLAWAPYRSAEVGLLWTLEGDEQVEAIRAAPLDPTHEDSGWAIAFRRGATIYAGAVAGGASLAAKGPLVKVTGLGPQVGSPAVAAQDGAVLVAWADRAQPSDPWSLRWMRFAPGDALADAKPFVPSEGGLGEHAMSPAIAAAGHGRFVIAWTEGPVATHQVRAQTMSGSGAPLGPAMAISDSGVNAGQAQLAILPDGHGVVAYLASSGTGPKASYEVLATPIVCP